MSSAYRGLARVGELLILKFSDEHDLLTSYYVPKYFSGECGDGECGRILARGPRKGYSLVKDEEGVVLYYWSHDNNLSYMNDPTASEKRLHSATKYSNEMVFLRSKLSDDSQDMDTDKVATASNFDIKILANTGISFEDRVLFYGYQGRGFKIGAIPIE